MAGRTCLPPGSRRRAFVPWRSGPAPRRRRSRSHAAAARGDLSGEPGPAGDIQQPGTLADAKLVEDHLVRRAGIGRAGMHHPAHAADPGICAWRRTRPGDQARHRSGRRRDNRAWRNDQNPAAEWLERAGTPHSGCLGREPRRSRHRPPTAADVPAMASAPAKTTRQVIPRLTSSAPRPCYPDGQAAQALRALTERDGSVYSSSAIGRCLTRRACVACRGRRRCVPRSGHRGCRCWRGTGWRPAQGRGCRWRRVRRGFRAAWSAETNLSVSAQAAYCRTTVQEPAKPVLAGHARRAYRRFAHLPWGYAPTRSVTTSAARPAGPA